MHFIFFLTINCSCIILTLDFQGQLIVQQKHFNVGTKGFINVGTKGFINVGTKGFINVGTKGFINVGTKGFINYSASQ